MYGARSTDLSRNEAICIQRELHSITKLPNAHKVSGGRANTREREKKLHHFVLFKFRFKTICIVISAVSTISFCSRRTWTAGNWKKLLANSFVYAISLAVQHEIVCIFPCDWMPSLLIGETFFIRHNCSRFNVLYAFGIHKIRIPIAMVNRIKKFRLSWEQLYGFNCACVCVCRWWRSS